MGASLIAEYPEWDRPISIFGGFWDAAVPPSRDQYL
jgi:hypothetical protein